VSIPRYLTGLMAPSGKVTLTVSPSYTLVTKASCREASAGSPMSRCAISKTARKNVDMFRIIGFFGDRIFCILLPQEPFYDRLLPREPEEQPPRCYGLLHGKGVPLRFCDLGRKVPHGGG